MEYARRPIVSAAGLLAMASVAHADGFDFVHSTQSSRLYPGDLHVSYGAAVQRSVSRSEKDPSGGGPAADSESERGYRGMQHRMSVYYAVFPRLMLGAEQSVAQTDADTMELGLFVPQARVRVSPDRWTVDLGLFGQGRLRRNRRRGSTAVVGVSVERNAGPLAFAASGGFETRPSQDVFGG